MSESPAAALAAAEEYLPTAQSRQAVPAAAPGAVDWRARTELRLHRLAVPTLRRLAQPPLQPRQLLDRVGDISQLMHARRAELTEGFARGADLIEVFNASGFNFSVLPGRALDISSAHFKGQSLCFRSGPGDVGPAFYEPEGFKWGRGWFGGLVGRADECGRKSGGPGSGA